MEGTTDVLNLAAFAKILEHPISGLIEEANIDTIEGNIPGEAFSRFQAIKFIEPSLKGLCLFDRFDRQSDPADPIPILQWKMRELENYFCKPEILIRWATSQANSLFTGNYPEIMQNCINDLTAPQYLKDKSHEWWTNEKLGDWAEDIFREFFIRVQQPMTMRKSTFYELIPLMKIEEMDHEIKEKLDAIYEVIKP